MHQKTKLTINASLLVLSVLIAGCSTFEVYRSYRSDANSNPNIIHRGDIETSISFERYTDFYSIGILGLPVIPVYLRISDNKTIEFRVFIRMTAHHEFSLLSRPCFLTEHREKICADRLEVNSMALVQDDGSRYDDKLPRWDHIRAFEKLENLVIVNDSDNIKDRVSNKDIENFYNYNGDPSWGHFTSNFSYNFVCKGKCPSELKLESDDLIVLDGVKINLGNQLYTLTSNSEYYFTRNIQ